MDFKNLGYLYGSLWQSMAVYGSLRQSTAVYCILRQSTAVYDNCMWFSAPSGP